MKYLVMSALVLSFASMTFAAPVATPVDTPTNSNNVATITNSQKVGEPGNIEDVSRAIVELNEAIKMMNSMLQNNEILFSTPEIELKFNGAHQQMMKGYFLLKQFMIAIDSKPLKGNKDAYNFIDTAKNLIWDSYWTFNKMLFLNELEFRLSSGDYKFSMAHAKERVAIELVKTYLYGASK